VILLGMVSPFVIRLRIEQLATAGNAAGAVYALSTLGSILGTFLPVFWLIPTFGTRPTITMLALLLAVISAAGLWAAGARRLYALVPLAVVLLGLLSGGAIRGAAYGQRIYEAESAYNYIQVVRDGTENDLVLNEGQAVHSIYDPTTIYTHGYWDDVLLAPFFGTGRVPTRIALVGLAGGTVARQFTAIDGPVPIDGVELDPKIVEVGRRFFGMTEPNLQVTIADGRYWMATEHARYDVILVDAYRQPYIPFYLTTREFFESAKTHLNPGGVLVINVGRTATDYRLVDALGGTLTAVFPRVFVLDTAHHFTNSLLFATSAPATVDSFRTQASAQANANVITRPAISAPEAKAGGYLAWPVNGIITQYMWAGHTGVDIAAPYGSGLAASVNGVISQNGWVAVGGLHICVKSGDLEECYYHMSAAYYSVGTAVTAGQVVGAIPAREDVRDVLVTRNALTHTPASATSRSSASSWERSRPCSIGFTQTSTPSRPRS